MPRGRDIPTTEMTAIYKPLNDIEATAAIKNDAPHARIFIGIKIAPEIAHELARLAKCLEGLPARLVPPNDIHLTLVPPWNEDAIPNAIKKLTSVTNKFDVFSLIFQRLAYGPQPRRPRLLWAECAATDDIESLHAALFRSFDRHDNRPFRPHVTLARIRRNGSAIARRWPMDQELLITQRVRSIELFQSPPPGEFGYKILASLRLGAGGRTMSEIGFEPPEA
jgi:2'-5' RNA ligase